MTLSKRFAVCPWDWDCAAQQPVPGAEWSNHNEWWCEVRQRGRKAADKPAESVSKDWWSARWLRIKVLPSFVANSPDLCAAPVSVENLFLFRVLWINICSLVLLHWCNVMMHKSQLLQWPRVREGKEGSQPFIDKCLSCSLDPNKPFGNVPQWY